MLAMAAAAPSAAQDPPPAVPAALQENSKPWAEARDRHHAAQVAAATALAHPPKGEPAPNANQVLSEAIAARESAALDMERALLDHHAVRDEIARQWMLGLRCVLEMQPANLAELLRDVPPSEIVVQSLRELEDRTEAAEGQAAKAGRETWALANALANVIQGRKAGASGNERRDAATGEEFAPRQAAAPLRQAG